ncbi:hypothetical protein [Aneurinibacillus tyrosinisolvens]|uniref:hypothetical protein n=1 Tax=Aneurinibacillus tyrosinisolvens TaxID=1443435 RepID=UPI00063F9310|nr:hypothetical protein [Aneurinibacillus tyrosinisolvens]
MENMMMSMERMMCELKCMKMMIDKMKSMPMEMDGNMEIMKAKIQECDEMMSSTISIISEMKEKYC